MARDMKKKDKGFQFAMFLAIFTLLAHFSAGSEAYGATFYISPTGNDSSGNGTSGSPWKTLDKAFSSGSGGDTYVLKNGTYNYAGSEIDSSVKSGSPGAYTIIRAENDGGAVITQSGGLNLPASVSYVQIEGIKWSGNYQKGILGHHIKFLRCAFNGGPTSGNVVNTGVGQNGTNAHHILFEDCWWYGTGGRYNLLFFNADYCVIRRAVIRHDGGWGPAGGNPEACLTFYESSNIHAQNVICIDSNDNYDYWYGSFAEVFNGVSGHPTSNNSWSGTMALVGGATGWTIEDDTTNSVLTNFVSVDTIGGAISFGGGKNTQTATLSYGTIMKKKLSYTGSFQGGVGDWGGGQVGSVTNLIIANHTGGADLDGVSASYFDTYNNGSTSSGTGRQTYNPETNGLLYLPRIEPSSNLSVHGTGGGRIGAQITKRIGVSGTLYGDPGWNTETTDDLWPWPNENRIKTDMASVSTRGFCTTGFQLNGTSPVTLTSYIWEYLGNPLPPDLGGGGGGGGGGGKTPMAPSGLSIQ